MIRVGWLLAVGSLMLRLRWNRGHGLHGSHRAEVKVEVESLATIDQLMQKLLGQS